MTDLTYAQRKALRRISRGGSISRTMTSDPIISQCFGWSIPTAPPKPIAEMDIIEYCDWEARLHSAYPVLSEYGAQLLAELEGEK